MAEGPYGGFHPQEFLPQEIETLKREKTNPILRSNPDPRIEISELFKSEQKHPNH